MTKDNTNKIKVQAIPKIDIKPWDDVYFTQLGTNHAEVLYMTSTPKQTIKKLSKTHYKVIRTGDVRRFAVSDDGKQIHVIKRSMRRLEQLIKTNFDTVRNANNALFVTMTYDGGKMTDTEKLYPDFEKFIKRLKYEYSDHKFEYIVVCEPHDSGGWHLHMLIKSDQERLFIPNEKMARIWRQGFTTTVRLKSDDVGAYYTAYFSNVETKAPLSDHATSDDVETAEVDGEYVATPTGKSKKFNKGERLRFYPKNMKFYRASRGIERPKAEKMMYLDVPDDLGRPRRTRTYSVDISSRDEETDEFIDSKRLNTVHREIYKKGSK